MKTSQILRTYIKGCVDPDRIWQSLRVAVLAVCLVVVAVDGCEVTGLVPQGAPCTCTDACLGNSQCQHDGKGGYACLCLPCQYFDEYYKQCLDTPDYGEVCTSVCASGFECYDDGTGVKRCQCPQSQDYDASTGRCVSYPGFGEECTDRCRGDLLCLDSEEGGKTCQCRDGFIYDFDKLSCSLPCVRDTAKDCGGLRNGDYPACFPRCKKGIYITCSNNYNYVRECALAWYVMPNGQRITDKMVYDPKLKRCERSVGYCPRHQDKWLE